MQTNIPPNMRRWERDSAKVPVRLVLKAESFKTDNSAITIDLSCMVCEFEPISPWFQASGWASFPRGEFPHAIPARVVWARGNRTSHWTFAGLEFLQTEDA
jgi:hypothetical protein